jgi:hypothetical protein
MKYNVFAAGVLFSIVAEYSQATRRKVNSDWYAHPSRSGTTALTCILGESNVHAFFFTFDKTRHYVPLKFLYLFDSNII